jgi:hypothetical protein
VDGQYRSGPAIEVLNKRSELNVAGVIPIQRSTKPVLTHLASSPPTGSRRPDREQGSVVLAVAKPVHEQLAQCVRAEVGLGVLDHQSQDFQTVIDVASAPFDESVGEGEDSRSSR